MQEASLKYQCPSVRVVIFNLQSIVKVLVLALVLSLSVLTLLKSFSFKIQIRWRQIGRRKFGSSGCRCSNAVAASASREHFILESSQIEMTSNPKPFMHCGPCKWSKSYFNRNLHSCWNSTGGNIYYIKKIFNFFI